MSPRPVLKRKFTSLREEIAYFEMVNGTKRPRPTFSETETGSTSGQEDSGDEASSSEVHVPQHDDSSSEDKTKPMGTPLMEPVVGEDGTPFHPIVAFFELVEKRRMRSGDLELAAPVGKRRASGDVQAEGRKAARHA